MYAEDRAREEREENNAQRSRRDSSYNDDNKRIVYEKGPSGAKFKVTYYSDGSNSVDNGHCGTTEYNEYGEEC